MAVNKTHLSLSHNLSCCYWLPCRVILLTMPEQRYISHADKGSVIGALTALLRSVQPAGAPNGNKQNVLTARDKSSQLQIGCSQVQCDTINLTISRLNMKCQEVCSLLKILLHPHLIQSLFILRCEKYAGWNCDSKILWMPRLHYGGGGIILPLFWQILFMIALWFTICGIDQFWVTI